MLKNRKSFFQKLGLFAAILGPGIITGSVSDVFVAWKPVRKLPLI